MYKTDALIKEHGRVGVGIERYDLAMCGNGAAIRFCFLVMKSVELPYRRREPLLT